jgi:hypothetical protein
MCATGALIEIPPSAAVRHRAIASSTLTCFQRIHWRFRSTKAAPAVRMESAISSAGGVTGAPPPPIVTHTYIKTAWQSLLRSLMRSVRRRAATSKRACHEHRRKRNRLLYADPAELTKVELMSKMNKLSLRSSATKANSRSSKMISPILLPEKSNSRLNIQLFQGPTLTCAVALILFRERPHSHRVTTSSARCASTVTAAQNSKSAIALPVFQNTMARQS